MEDDRGAFKLNREFNRSRNEQKSPKKGVFPPSPPALWHAASQNALPEI
jgi:hypothetical protein